MAILSIPDLQNQTSNMIRISTHVRTFHSSRQRSEWSRVNRTGALSSKILSSINNTSGEFSSVPISKARGPHQSFERRDSVGKELEICYRLVTPVYTVIRLGDMYCNITVFATVTCFMFGWTKKLAM
jgi:hypothetical protein